MKTAILFFLGIGIAAAQCGPNGTFNGLSITGDLLCTGKTGAAGYTAPFAAQTGLTVTAATHGQGNTPYGVCYDNAVPANLIAQTSGFPTTTSTGTIVFAWSGSKTGNCLISGLGNTVGPTGAMGATGSTGSAATIAVGTVTTGAAGSSATVTNSGTSGAAIFDMAIPRGATGATGNTGATGATGAAGANGTNGTNGTNGANGAGNNTVCTDATGSTTTYTCPTPNPTVTTLTGLQVAFIPQTTNSGSSTLNVAALGAKTLKQSDCSTNLSSGALVGGTAYSFAYNGTVFCQTSGAGGGSTFTGSGASAPSFSATPTFSLADLSGTKSPLRFEPAHSTGLTGNVTSVSFTNTTAGAKFSIAWLQDGTGGRTVAYGGSASNACTVVPTANKTTTQFFEVAADGSTVIGTGCASDEGPVERAEETSAPSTPPSGVVCWWDSTDHDLECKNSSGVVFKMFRSGVDANPVTGQVTATHLSSALPVAQGGTGATTAQGNGTKVQLSTGTTTTDNCVKFDSNGNTVDAGAACGTGGAGGTSGRYTQSFTGQTSVTLAHNLALSPVDAYILECFDGSHVKINPASQTTTDLNNVAITFSPAATGLCTVLTGGLLPNGGYSQAFTTQTSVALAHNLGTLAVQTACFDGSGVQVFPASTTLTDTNTVTVTFSPALTGNCIVTSNATVTTSGSGTVTASGSPAAHQVGVFTGGTDVKGVGVGATDKPLVGVSAADPAFSKLTLTNPATAATLTIADNKTLTSSNTLTLAGTDSTTITFQGTDTYVGRGTTDTLTNKTLTSPLVTAVVAPSTPSAGLGAVYVDSTSKNISVKDDAGVVKHGVQTDTGTANNYISAISDSGAITKSRPACATLSDSSGGCSMSTTAAGDLSGTLPSATVTNGSHITNASIPNSGLVNAATTVNGQTCTLGSSCTVALSAVNPQTATYQVLAADFSNYKTITVASGTFTITLVASGSQPANGQFIRVFNYGSGVVTIARSGQNINGGTTSLTLPAASATAPSSLLVESDGTNYFASLMQVPASTTCSNQAVTAVNGTAAATCTTITSAYTNNTIAQTGVDINTSNQVTATHLSAALPVNQGGTGTTSTLTGLVRGSGTAMTAAELSGDVTTSGSNAATLANIPTAVPMAGTLLATAIAAPSTPASGKGSVYVDSTSKNISVKDDAGVVKHGVQTDTGTANNYISAISDAGAITKSRPACATLSDSAGGCSMSTTGGGDISGTLPSPTVAKINGTSVPTTTTADQVLVTTASATGTWKSVNNCGDSSHALSYNTSTHAWGCQAITGAAATVPFYDVTAAAYGAVGDGVADAQPGIQLAINAAIAAGGGTVYFPYGTYRLKTNQVLAGGSYANLILGANVRLLGAPGSKIIQDRTLCAGTGCGRHNLSVANTSTAAIGSSATADALQIRYGTRYVAGAVAIGAYSMTFTTHSDASHFAAGDYISIYNDSGGVDQAQQEHLIVESSNSSTGVLTLTEPFTYAFATPYATNGTTYVNQTINETIENLIIEAAVPLFTTEVFNFTIKDSTIIEDSNADAQPSLMSIWMGNTAPRAIIKGSTFRTIAGGSLDLIELMQRGSSRQVYDGNTFITTRIGQAESCNNQIFRNNTFIITPSGTTDPALVLSCRNVLFDKNVVRMHGITSANGITDWSGAGTLTDGGNVKITNNDIVYDINASYSNSQALALFTPDIYVANNRITNIGSTAAWMIGLSSTVVQHGLISANEFIDNSTNGSGVVMLSSGGPDGLTIRENQFLSASTSSANAIYISTPGSAYAGANIIIGNLFGNFTTPIGIDVTKHPGTRIWGNNTTTATQLPDPTHFPSLTDH